MVRRLYVDLLPDRLETAIVIGDAKESLGAAQYRDAA